MLQNVAWIHFCSQYNVRKPPRKCLHLHKTSTVPEQELRSSCVNSWMGTAPGKDGYYCPRNRNHLRDGYGSRYVTVQQIVTVLRWFNPRDGY